MAKRLTYDRLKKMSPSEIGKLSTSQTADLLRQFREKFKMREKQFARAGKNVYSPALEKMQNYYEDRGTQSTEAMSRNRMQSELFRIQEFFNSETADVKNARRVMRDQDARIFGTNAKGNPLHRMTTEERSKFWSLYEEFMRSKPQYNNPYMSGKIQQYLGEITLSGKKEKGVFKKGDIGIIKALNELQQKIEEGEPEYDSFGFNIFSGRGVSK